MIHLLGKIPPKVIVACSGGADSMAVVDFLLRGGREVVVAHFEHGTSHSGDARRHVEKYCEDKGLICELGGLKHHIQRPSHKSKEQWWREERYWFFREVLHEHRDAPLITCHHLDDQVETWIFSSLHGKSKLIPYKRPPHIIRPFLLTRKATLESWCHRHDVPYVIDPSNMDTKYMRNHIRHNVMPQALVVNPGLHKTMYKKTLAQYEEMKLAEERKDEVDIELSKLNDR